MARHQFLARLWSLFGIAAFTAGCGVGEISGGPGEPRFGVEGAPDVGNAGVPLCPGASADISASNGWRSSQASQPADDALYLEFKARPTAANLDGLMAVGAVNIDDFTEAAITVRFADNGMVDVRDGSFYSADVSYLYEPGVWYSIGVAADIANKTYDVEIGPCDEPRQTLIEGASFRDEADVSGELSTWAVWSSQAAALEVSTPAWMAAGGCAPATCESLGHVCGQPSDGCGGTLSCGSCGGGQSCASGVCVDEPTPPPSGGGGPDPSGRGPTGHWPPGFPAYASTADIVTNGSTGGLDSALNDPKCADGCLIEHPGNITTVGGAMNSRVGGSNDEIVIRPPIGQRNDYTVTTGYSGSSSNGLNLPGVLIAGYEAATSLFVVEGAINSGFAWIEIEIANGGDINCFSNGGQANCLFYELVSRVYDCDTCGDRGGVRTSGGASATMFVTGSYLAGSKGLPPQDHADAFQYSGDDRGTITIEDSYIWPSWDKALQGGAAEQFYINNCWMVTPGLANQLWPYESLNLGGFYMTTATTRIDGSTLGGATNPQFETRISNTEWFNPANSSIVDLGGNDTTLTSMPAPPPAPSHTQLDTIWSP